MTDTARAVVEVVYAAGQMRYLKELTEEDRYRAAELLAWSREGVPRGLTFEKWELLRYGA